MLLANCSAWPRTADFLRSSLMQEYGLHAFANNIMIHEWCGMSGQAVHELMQRLGVHQPRRRGRPPLSQNEWWFSDLERVLGVANSTLHQWRKRGQLQVRWHDQSQRWVAWADETELQRLQQRCALPAREASRHRWLDAQPSQRTVSPHATTV